MEGENSGEIEWFRTLSKTDLPIKDFEGLSKAKEISEHIVTVMDQIKYLRNAVEHTIKLHELKGSQGNAANDSESTSTENKVDETDLQEQVFKLESRLSAKCEQIATLRTAMKANKNNAEIALTNLKSKYTNDKCTVVATISKLRNELRNWKELYEGKLKLCTES